MFFLEIDYNQVGLRDVVLWVVMANLGTGNKKVPFAPLAKV